MTDRESILLKIMIITGILAAFITTTANLRTSRKEIKQELAAYEKSLKTIDSKKKQSTVQETPITVESRKPLSASTAAVLAELKKYDILPKRYSISESTDTPYTEILFTCKPDSVFNFLFNILSEDTPYTINYFSAVERNSTVSVTLRISNIPGYKISSENIFTSPHRIARLFIKPEKHTDKPVELLSEPQVQIKDGNSQFSIIGSITSEKGITTLYLKNFNTGQISAISSDHIEKTDTSYIFTIDGNTYKITLPENHIK